MGNQHKYRGEIRALCVLPPSVHPATESGGATVSWSGVSFKVAEGPKNAPVAEPTKEQMLFKELINAVITSASRKAKVTPSDEIQRLCGRKLKKNH